MPDALCDIITLDQPLYFNIFFIIKIPYYDIHGICIAPKSYRYTIFTFISDAHVDIWICSKYQQFI